MFKNDLVLRSVKLSEDHNFTFFSLFLLLSRAGVYGVSPVNTFHQNNSRIIQAGCSGDQDQEKYLPLHVQFQVFPGVNINSLDDWLR